MSYFCLCCQRDLYEQSKCSVCDLPAIDRSACAVIYRLQIQTVAVLIQRRADVLLRASYPVSVWYARPEIPDEPRLLRDLWRFFRTGLEELLSNIRGLWLSMRQAVS